ncbi:uncharacterized protein MAL8P1.12-like isoform X1 [Vanessa atalanta]|uniref:uncharacterized protein MAL8P1.12-like isoform X1 n=1 Tax=Vanessa atalanta TaxID=42275 RepID=UPI001FCDB81C|nr:uncharacterized protein MAL8P1.12-like isoform X1 [Vanessa atalanta]
MKFRKKISFSIIVFMILLESLVCSFPHTFSSNPYINEDSWNVIQDSICETLCFQGSNKSPIQCKSHLRCFPNNNFVKGVEYNSGEKVDNEFIIPPEFSSAANYRDLCNFPEVEYPLSAKEMWKPNYWNIYPTDYSNKNINTECANSMFSDHFSKIKSMQKFDTKYKPGKLTTKSLSDSRKNIASLKTKGLNDLKNDTSHNNATRNLSNNTNIPLDNSKLCNFYTTVSPFMPYSEKNISTSEVNLNVCLKDKNVLEHRNSLNVDNTSYLTSQPELLLEYSETFKKEIEAILRTMADNIISKNIESNKNKSSRKEVLNDNWELNLTHINNITDKFDKEMTSKIKSVADSIMNTIDLTENSCQKLNNDKNPLKPDILCEEKITSVTQAPKHTDVCTDTKMNDSKMDTKETTCKESDIVKNNSNTCPSFNSLSSRTVPENNVTCKKETLDFCKSEANIINEMDKDDEIIVPTHNTDTENMQSVSGNSDQEISLEEDFTTDSYPENNDWYYALSTVAPQPSNVDMWRDTNVIEPDKSLAYPDELEQYFILSSD